MESYSLFCLQNTFFIENGINVPSETFEEEYGKQEQIDDTVKERIQIQRLSITIFIFLSFSFSFFLFQKSLKFARCAIDTQIYKISHELLSHQCIVQVVRNRRCNRCAVNYYHIFAYKVHSAIGPADVKRRHAGILSKNVPINIYASYFLCICKHTPVDIMMMMRFICYSRRSIMTLQFLHFPRAN